MVAVTVFTGKVDLGTGTRTALAQMAADELDVAFERIDMVMGDTATTPDQWLTGANLTIFQGGAELRRAAASAREALVAKGAERLGVPASRARGGGRRDPGEDQPFALRQLPATDRQGRLPAQGQSQGALKKHDRLPRGRYARSRASTFPAR